MRIVVYPHLLEIGGSQYNAIDLAAAVRDLGHEVLVFGQPGPLTARISELGLEFVPAPAPRGRPDPRVMLALTRLVRRRRIDLVHGYEWTAGLEGYFGPRAALGVPAMTTVLSMSVAPFVPRDMPLVVGTAQIAAHERDLGRAAVEVVELPVDLRHNHPDAVDAAAFAREHDLGPTALRLVAVQRLAAELKLEGLLSAVEALERLGPDRDVQLVLVGDGPSRDLLERRAAEANGRLGRRAVVLTGELRDPRPAYAAADACLGMGGSALRAMAFGKPLIVQGEQGFFELLSAETEAQFAWTGWYGIGAGPQNGPPTVQAHILTLLEDPAGRARLGAHARELAQRRHALDILGAAQAGLYERALAEHEAGTRPAAGALLSAARQITLYRTRRRIAQVRGRLADDDFNSAPVAATGPPGPPAPGPQVERARSR